MSRYFGACAGVFGFIGVMLGALASHALAPRLTPEDLQRVIIAAVFAVAHALLLMQVASLLRQQRALLLGIAGHALVLGVVLFCGSLLARALLGWSSMAAPFGGALLMAAWLILAVWFVWAPSRAH